MIFNPRVLLASVILLYQKTISRDHGFLRFLSPYGHCPFVPSCSEYSRQAVLKYGVIKGLFKSFARILRCHPFTKGGYDPLR